MCLSLGFYLLWMCGGGLALAMWYIYIYNILVCHCVLSHPFLHFIFKEAPYTSRRAQSQSPRPMSPVQASWGYLVCQRPALLSLSLLQSSWSLCSLRAWYPGHKNSKRSWQASRNQRLMLGPRLGCRPTKTHAGVHWGRPLCWRPPVCVVCWVEKWEMSYKWKTIQDSTNERLHWD